MAAAIAAANSSAKVCLLEQGKEPGKKILSTGNGRCNLTNSNLSASCYPSSDRAFVETVLHSFSEKDTFRLMDELGVLLTEEDGFVYPMSFQAQTVRDALEAGCRERGVLLRTETRVNAIRLLPADSGSLFEVTAENADGTRERILAKCCILCPGSKAAPKTGSDGSGYGLAESLGHRVTEPLPALVQLKSSSKLCPGLAGVRVEAECILMVNGRETAAVTGELQLVDYGLSGFPIFQLSSRAVRAVSEGKSVQVRVAFLPGLSEERLQEFALNGISRFPDRSLAELFHGIFPWKVAVSFLKETGLSPTMKGRELSARHREKVLSFCRCLKNWTVPISGFNSFDRAQTCSGGICTEEIHPDTMESRLLPGLYLAGEVMDVDGLCGGYNLQWALATGTLAGRSAARKGECV